MWSIIVGAIVLFAVSALWFTVIFGKMWAELMGFNMDNPQAKNNGMTVPLIGNFILNLLTAGVLYYLFTQVIALSYGQFIKSALILWLGFALPIFFNAALWERKSWKLVLLNSSFGIISISILSAVIYFMQ